MNTLEDELNYLKGIFKYLTIDYDGGREVKISAQPGINFRRTYYCATNKQLDYIMSLAKTKLYKSKLQKYYSKQCISNLIDLCKRFNVNLILE
jgi:hypothetical protein